MATSVMPITFKPGFEAHYTKLGGWKRHGLPYSCPASHYKKISDRPWQLECLASLEDKRHWIVTAPMASGKTLLICALVFKKLAKDSALRVLISVPQTVIADGFTAEKFEVEGERVNWTICGRNDLCSDSRDPIASSTIAHTLHWLNRPASLEVEDRVLVCTHATLAEAYGREPRAFRNVLVVIDEAHHALCAEGQNMAVQNKLGALISHAVADHIELGLTTATFFRSDTCDIIPAKHLDKFTRYRLGFPEFLESIRPFKHFSYDFLLYEESWFDALKGLFARRIGKTIVYIPHSNSSASVGKKHHDVRLVIRAIAGTDEPVVQDADKPVMRVKRGNRWLKVVNLVDEEGRGPKKEAIARAHRGGDAAALDVIIALQMFREGANWEWADRSIIIGPRHSLVDLLQTIGRLFRRPKGRAKDHANVVHLLSKGLTDDAQEIRDNLNNFLKAVFASMLLEQLFTPPACFTERTDKSFKPRLTLSDYLGTVCEPEILLTKIFDDLLEWRQKNGSTGVDAAFERITKEALEPYGLGHVAHQVAALLKAACLRRMVKLRGISASVLDVNLLDTNPLDFTLAYTSGLYGIKDLHSLRTRLHGAFVSYEEARAYARAHGIRTGEQWRQHIRSLRQQEPA